MNPTEERLILERNDLRQALSAKEKELADFRSSKESNAIAEFTKKYAGKYFKVKSFLPTKIYRAVEDANTFEFIHIHSIESVTRDGFTCKCDIVKIAFANPNDFDFRLTDRVYTSFINGKSSNYSVEPDIIEEVSLDVISQKITQAINEINFFGCKFMAG